MLRNDQIQAAIVAYLKSKSDITDEIGGSTEIREDTWQGRDFDYPNVRVDLVGNVPTSSDCNRSDITLSILAFSEDSSSLEADTIAGIINNELHDKGFSSNSIAFTMHTTNLIPSVRQDERTWRSEVILEGTASG